jgi:hypothetical protein
VHVRSARAGAIRHAEPAPSDKLRAAAPRRTGIPRTTTPLSWPKPPSASACWIR